jgi:sugar phosphate isomerase/epimerase
MYSRRDLAKIALGAFSAGRLLAKPNSTIRGVTIGIHSRSFRDQPLEAAVAAMVQVGIGSCELWEGHVTPPRMTRKGLREWREAIAIEQFQLVAGIFNKAGVKIHAYNYDFDEDFSDLEIARGFEMTKALGASLVTASSPPGMVKGLNAAAVKAGMFVGMRNRDAAQPGNLSNPDDLDAAMRGNSNIGICLDLGDYSAAGYDPVKFITSHLDRTYAVYLRDRKQDHGESVPFGQGNTPLAAVLKLIQGRKSTIPAMIDYDYKGRDPVAEVDRGYAFCRQILTAKFAR